LLESKKHLFFLSNTWDRNVCSAG